MKTYERLVVSFIFYSTGILFAMDLRLESRCEPIKDTGTELSANCDVRLSAPNGDFRKLPSPIHRAERYDDSTTIHIADARAQANCKLKAGIDTLYKFRDIIYQEPNTQLENEYFFKYTLGKENGAWFKYSERNEDYAFTQEHLLAIEKWNGKSLQPFAAASTFTAMVGCSVIDSTLAGVLCDEKEAMRLRVAQAMRVFAKQPAGWVLSALANTKLIKSNEIDSVSDVAWGTYSSNMWDGQPNFDVAFFSECIGR